MITVLHGRTGDVKRITEGYWGVGRAQVITILHKGMRGGPQE